MPRRVLCGINLASKAGGPVLDDDHGEVLRRGFRLVDQESAPVGCGLEGCVVACLDQRPLFTWLAEE